MTTKIGTATDYQDLLKILDGFLTTTGHAWGLRFTGTGNGRMRGPGGTTGGYIGTAASVTETITITATSATTFSVVGSISGNLGNATVGTDFASSVVAFRIVAGSTAFAVGDKFTLNTGPKWSRERLGGVIENTYRTGTYNNIQNLFDDNASSTSIVSASTLPQQVQVQMTAPTPVRAISIWSSGTAASAPASFALQWSDDGSTWNTAQSWTGQTWTATYQRRDFVLTADPGAHLYWRVNITATSNANNSAMSELRMFGDAAMKWGVTTRAEFAWKAPGVDGAQEIFVAGFSNTDPSNDRYNLAFRGFRFWQDRALSILDIPDHSGSKYTYLAKTPIAYWMIANGGRVIVATRISGIYQYVYAGFGLPYETPSVHPFPYLVAGSAVGQTLRWDDTTSQLRTPADPMCNTSSSTVGPTNCSLAAMFPSGVFEGIGNRYPSGSSSEGSYSSSQPIGSTWPYSWGVNGQTQPFYVRDNIDGSKPLLPVVICFGRQEPRHVWGEFDGVYYTTGFAQASEAILRDGAIDVMTIQNVFRTTVNAYSAIALD